MPRKRRWNSSGKKVITWDGNMPEPCDVVITRVKFTDYDDSKISPILILLEGWGGVVLAWITTNRRMNGIIISRSYEAAQDSVIKLNYIFTITNEAIIETVFHLDLKKEIWFLTTSQRSFLHWNVIDKFLLLQFFEEKSIRLAIWRISPQWGIHARYVNHIYI